MRNVVSIDWFACTVKNLSPEKVIADCLLMEIEHFSLEEWGINKYQFHYSCGEINVYFNDFNGDERMGVFFQLKGQGCKQYAEFFEGNENNWIGLTERFYACRANFTRIDICNDVYDGKLKVATIYHSLKEGNCVGTAKVFKYHEKAKTEDGETIGETVVIGVEGNQQLAVYNKLMEQAGQGKDVSSIETWVRVELRLWSEKANLIAKQIVKRRPLKEIFFESVNGHYRFVVPNSKIKRKYNRPAVDWWKNYIETEEMVRLSVKREKTTLTRKEKYIETSVAKSLATVYEAKKRAYGEEKANAWLVNKVLDTGASKLTEADQAEIEQYVREQESEAQWGIVYT